MAVDYQSADVKRGKADEKFIRLAAFQDDEISAAAAEQLIQMSKDEYLPTHNGKDLPIADRSVVIAKSKAKKR